MGRADGPLLPSPVPGRRRGKTAATSEGAVLASPPAATVGQRLLPQQPLGYRRHLVHDRVGGPVRREQELEEADRERRVRSGIGSPGADAVGGRLVIQMRRRRRRVPFLAGRLGPLRRGRDLTFVRWDIPLALRPNEKRHSREIWPVPWCLWAFRSAARARPWQKKRADRRRNDHTTMEGHKKAVTALYFRPHTLDLYSASDDWCIQR
ncbi:hypothetical protein ACHAWF_014735 [Thalassiosira exigua]